MSAGANIVEAYNRWVKTLCGGTCREASGLATPTTVPEARAHAKTLRRLLKVPGGRVETKLRATGRLDRFLTALEATVLREPMTEDEVVAACSRGLLDMDEAAASLELRNGT